MTWKEVTSQRSGETHDMSYHQVTDLVTYMLIHMYIYITDFNRVNIFKSFQTWSSNSSSFKMVSEYVIVIRNCYKCL